APHVVLSLRRSHRSRLSRLLLHCPPHHRHLHSFPTRRSSDLERPCRSRATSTKPPPTNTVATSARRRATASPVAQLASASSTSSTGTRGTVSALGSRRTSASTAARAAAAGTRRR